MNTKIQFCLAKRSESGHATDGVNRIYSPLTNYNFNGIDKDLKNLSRWEPLSYINIWLVNSLSWYGNASIAGYAYPPSVAGSQLDGLVLESEYFGKDKSLTVPLIHEMGHYLGLLHTFNGGCKNDNCLIDGDKVCDTPPDGVNIAISCNGSFKVNSCFTDEDDNSINNPFRDIGLGGIGDQVDLEDNFMDYGFYSCAVNFTAGQTQRMRFYLEEKRSGLTYSRGCLEPCNELIVASFQTDKNQYNAGDTILITNNCTGASKFYWLLNGQFVSSDSSPKIIAFGNGPSILELLVWNDNVNCDSVSVSAIINIDCVTRAFIENTISDGKLIVKSKSVFFDSIYTKIEKQDSIFYSTNKELDSIQLENGVFLITHIAFGHGCNDTIRVVFEINNIISEICDNDKDDDLDGFVDGYDDNCECNNNHFNGGCISNCEFIDSIYPIKMRQKWSTDILHDLEFNLSQFLIFDSLIINPFSLGSLDTSYHGFDLINAKNGVKIKRIISDTLINNFYWGRYFAITKMENSDLFYILYPTQDNRIILSDLSNNIIWSSKRYFNFYERPNYLKITDFNGDGSLEFYYGNRIFNFASGQLLFNGHESMGCISYPFKIAAPKLYEQCGWGAFSVAADLTSHQGLELAAGNVVYEVDLINLSDTINNTFEVKFAPSQVLDGATAVADVNSDGLLDVIVNRGAKNSESGGLWVWDPRTMEIIAEVIFPQLSLSHQPGYMNGGIPIIANVDDDCFPEIIVSFVNEIRIYKYTGGQNLNLLYSKPISDFSGVISASIFDLNWDNINELIIRDERYLRILNARTGTTIDSFEIHSGTLTEQPIIADIDNDRNAEILVSGYLPFEKDAQRIFCFESANLPWAPARSVWNQAGYHITNVNDDLTIPRQPQNNAAFFDTDSCAQTTCPQLYNTFMCQATYRTQDGCVKWPAADLSVDALSYRCEPDSLYLTLVVRNQSDNALKNDSLVLGIYEQSQEAPFHNHWIHLPKDANGHIVNADTITLAIANDRPNRTGLRFRINILDPSTTFSQNIKGLTAVLECDYLNNTDSLALSLAPLTLDLGSDITKCRTSVFTLQAPTNFVSYVWSDGSTQDSYTSAAPGLHVLTATDVCGRIYTDSVRFEIDSTLIPHLGNDTLICEDQLLIYDLAGFDQVQWLPGPAVSCDTCLQTIVISDTDINLVALTNVNGCFDVDTVNIAVQALKKRNENLTICKGDSVLFNQTYLSEPGSYEYRTGFCDSLVTLELNVLAPDSIMLPRQTICEGDSAFFLGKWWKTEINSTIKLKNQFDCDSFITFELRVIDTLFQRTNASVCQGDSLFANGQWLCSAGIYTFEYTTPQGCDSIEEVQLTLLPSYTLTESATLCAGDSLQRWGKWFKTTGTYSQAFVTQNGCDSTEVLQLTINPLITDNRQYEICEGSTLTLNGIEYDIAGTFTTQLPSITGCDTLLTFTLSFSDRIQKTENYTICTGDSININGQWINQAQTLQYTLEEAGCITEITAEVSLLPRDTSVLNELLCPGDSIFINGSWHMGNKDFSYALTGSDGCDSIVNAYITSLTWPQPPVVNLDCEVAAYEATINLLTPWQVTWSNGDTTATTQITSSPASATIHYGSRCFKTFDLMTTTLPDLNSLPSIADQNISTGQGLPLNVPLDASEWKIKWLPSTLTSCDTCFTTMLFTDTNATITLELTHISGCTYTRTFNLIVENPPAVIVIPNVLSPLTPGPNASWDFTLPPGYTLINASVYDRWGSRVFQGLPPWDGTFNNCPLLPGVYVYTIQYLDPTGNTVFLKGDVTLVR
ncbi:MAG TPA: M43 family zinc metalloprotease [Saprospiraceae bacterium]|nr:M43 family zinc metalloprotease [Saprospiraceae bacterium]